MSFSNSYSLDLFRQQQARKRHNRNDIDGAEKPLDKDTAARIARHEYQSEEIARFYSEMARLNRLGMNPDREIMEKIFDKSREV